MDIGPNLINDNLVFGFDTGYGVADPGVSTRFFKGKPTTNLQVNGVAAGHNSGNYGNVVTVADAPEKGPRWKKVTISNRGSNFRIIQWTYTSHVADAVYSHSAEFDWGNMRDKGYYMPFDGNGGGTRVHYINRDYTTNGGSNINTNRQDGHFASTIVKSIGHIHAWFIDNNTTGVSGLNDYFYYRDYQVEKETEASPYVDGSRSDTASLIDLAGTTDVDVSSISFNSTGQPTFDGTDDVINLPNNLGYGVNSVSVFAWYKINGTPGNGYHIICGDTALEISIHSSATYIRTGVSTTSGRHVQNDGNQTLNDGNYHYYGFTFDGSTKRAYIDGVQVGTQSVAGTLTTSFSGRKVGAFSGGYYANGDLPVYKVYSKVLTASEIKQNYNAYKNRFNI